MGFREEHDTMGAVKVPLEAYYGAQTQRAVDNFSISGLRFPRIFIRALGLIKKHAGRVNMELGLLPAKLAEAIMAASQDIIEGKMDDQFPVDIFQTGSGTSTNMNANEVTASRANEIITGVKGGKTPVHPNDHVNMGQSSNDVIPTAIHVAALMSIREELAPAMESLADSLGQKAEEFKDVRKIGRTHLQDAVPISLGNEFSGYARQVEQGIRRVLSVEVSLAELALGGTAVGSGMNTSPEFAPKVIEGIAKETGISFVEAQNHYEAQAAQDAAVETSGALKSYAVGLVKISNDVRWLASGPRCGLGEINIPALQPGSSIMPGKVNPVIPEAVIQVAAQVIGNDAAITFGGQGGYFELNVMLPLIAQNLLQSIEILARATQRLDHKCIRGIEANKEKCEGYIEGSLAMCTPLVPEIGYEQAAAIAKEAYSTGETVRAVALRKGALPDDKLNEILDNVISG